MSFLGYGHLSQAGADPKRLRLVSVEPPFFPATTIPLIHSGHAPSDSFG